MKEAKMCPLLSAGERVNCIGKECEWWLAMPEQCSVTFTAVVALCENHGVRLDYKEFYPFDGSGKCYAEEWERRRMDRE